MLGKLLQTLSHSNRTKVRIERIIHVAAAVPCFSLGSSFDVLRLQANIELFRSEVNPLKTGDS